MKIALRSNIVTLFMVWVVLPQDASAHHGKEFLLIATTVTPHRGSWYALAFFDVPTRSSKLGIEPGILYGVTSHWSLELHTHLDRTNGKSTFESLGLEQRFHLLGKPEGEDKLAESTHSMWGLLWNLKRHCLLKAGITCKSEVSSRIEVSG